MSVTQAPSFNQTVYQGTHGNLSVAYSENVLSAVAVDDEIQLLSLPAGLRVSTILLYSVSGLGEGAGVDVLVDGVVVASVDDFSVPATHTRSGPLVVTPVPVTYSIRVKGEDGVTATGDVLLQLYYTSEGTL